jgi:hypothetical protein
MRRILLILTLMGVSAAAASAQAYLYTWSYLYADQGSGQISAFADSFVWVWFTGTYESYDMTAYVYGNLSGPNVPLPFAQDNCGTGCASSSIYSQVPQLGITLNLQTTHYGYVAGGSLGYFSQQQTGLQTFPIPPATNLMFTSVDARNPNQVYWTIGNGSS